MQSPKNASPLDLAAEWRSMQRRIVAQLESGSGSDLGDACMPLDARVYTDPARLEAERVGIFREQPLLVGLSSELAEPGERILFDVAGTPIVVLRGPDGGLRAFLNLCTHRGSRLVDTCEPGTRLMCPFHGWTYDLDGELRATPHARAFEGLDKKALGLVRVPVAERNGLIFVKARPGEESIDLEEFLGPIDRLLAALELGSLRRVAAGRLDIRANWKLALDTGREIYHVPVVHRESLSRNLHPHVAVFDYYGRHNRYSGAGLDFESLVGRDESEWPAMSYQAVHYLFPNTTLSFTHSVDGRTPIVTLSRVFPGESIGDAVTLIATYKRPGEGSLPDEQVAAMHEAVLGIVGSEDYRVAEGVWQSLVSAPAGQKLVLGRNEVLLQRYHQDVAAAVGMPLP